MAVMRESDAVICASDALKSGDMGVRFQVKIDGEILPAFAIRHQGNVYAFINQCAHQGVELDWKQGYFFDAEGDFLICATHGARYHPDSGECASGPCVGGELSRLGVVEQDGMVRLTANGAHLVLRGT